MLRREYLIRLRTDMHFTRENVAKELGVKDRYLKNIEDGRSPIYGSYNTALYCFVKAFWYINNRLGGNGSTLSSCQY